MAMSLATSPSSMRETGTPVQRLTTSATSSSSTSSFKNRCPSWSEPRATVACSMRLSRSGTSP